MTERVELELAAAARFDVLACCVEQAISRPTRAQVTVHGDDALDFADAIGKPATLALVVGHDERRFALTLASVRYEGRHDGRQRFTLELASHPFALELRRDTRKFRKHSAEQIVSAVLDGHGVPHRFELVRPTPRRNYCVELDERDRDFVERLLAFEGIYYVAADDGSLTMGDRSPALPLVDEAPVPLVHGEGALRHATPGVTALASRARVTSGRVTVGDFDWKRPDLDLLASATAERFEELEIYDWLTGYRNPEDGVYLARTRLELERALASTLEGRGTVLAFAAGRAFRLADAPAGAGGAEHLLVHVTHELRFDGAAAHYDNRFTAIPRDRPFRPPLVARPTVRGHHTARVRGPEGIDIHTDRHARFRAQFHWDREGVATDADSRWLRLVQESTTSLFVARVGWEMFVTHIDGDPDRPLGLWRALNGVMPPVYAQPGNKTVMSVKTPSSPGGGGYNEWRMNDASGAMAIDLRAERDFVVRTQHDQRESVGRDDVRVVQGGLSRAVEETQVANVGQNDELAVGGTLHHSVGGDLMRTVGAAEHVETGDGLFERADGDDTELALAVRLTFAGSLHLPRPKDTLAGMVTLPDASTISLGAAPGLPTGAGPSSGALAAPAAPSPATLAAALPSANDLIGSIKRNSAGPALRAVGGAEIAVCGGALTHAAEKGLTGAVGGARVIVAQGGDVVHEATDLVMRAGATMVRKAGGDASYACKTASVVVGGDASLTAGETFALRAASVTLEARERLSLVAGSAGVELTPSGVALRGRLSLTPDDALVVAGAKRDQLGT